VRLTSLYCLFLKIKYYTGIINNVYPNIAKIYSHRKCTSSTRFTINAKLIAIHRLCHVHVLVAGIDRYLRVAGWLSIVSWLLNIDRLLGCDSAHLVLLNDGVAGNALLASLHLGATVAVEIDAEGDQSAAEENPLNCAECSSGLSRACWAIVVCASLELGAVTVIAGVCVDVVDPIRYGSDDGKRCESREPENDGQALKDKVCVFVIGLWGPECGDFDVADKEQSPNEGEDADAISSIEEIAATSVGG
jgi:hypothetical protein